MPDAAWCSVPQAPIQELPVAAVLVPAAAAVDAGPQQAPWGQVPMLMSSCLESSSPITESLWGESGTRSARLGEATSNAAPLAVPCAGTMLGTDATMPVRPPAQWKATMQSQLTNPSLMHAETAWTGSCPPLMADSWEQPQFSGMSFVKGPLPIGALPVGPVPSSHIPGNPMSSATLPAAMLSTPQPATGPVFGAGPPLPAVPLIPGSAGLLVPGPAMVPGGGALHGAPTLPAVAFGCPQMMGPAPSPMITCGAVAGASPLSGGPVAGAVLPAVPTQVTAGTVAGVVVAGGPLHGSHVTNSPHLLPGIPPCSFTAPAMSCPFTTPAMASIPTVMGGGAAAAPTVPQLPGNGRSVGASQREASLHSGVDAAFATHGGHASTNTGIVSSSLLVGFSPVQGSGHPVAPQPSNAYGASTVRRSTSSARGRTMPGSRRLVSRRLPARRPGARTVGRVGGRTCGRSGTKVPDLDCGTNLQWLKASVAHEPDTIGGDMDPMAPFSDVRPHESVPTVTDDGELGDDQVLHAGCNPTEATRALIGPDSRVVPLPQLPQLPQSQQMPQGQGVHGGPRRSTIAWPQGAAPDLLQQPHTADIPPFTQNATMADAAGQFLGESTQARHASPLPGALLLDSQAPQQGEAHLGLHQITGASTIACGSAMGFTPELAEAQFAVATPQHIARPLRASRAPVLVWRCKHPHGLFSMFSLALGHAERCEKQGWSLIIDWSGEELLYRGPPGEPNLWTAFFKQPAELKHEPEELLRVLRQGEFYETARHDAVFGAYRGVIQDYGGIPPHLAAHGRALCRRSVVLRERFTQRVQAAAETLLGGSHRWLAVHIRRSDKACEAKANLELTDDDIMLRIVAQCSVWCCDAVFLCSDDAALKQRLRARLSGSTESGGAGLVVNSYPSTLSAVAGQAAHFDKSLDKYQKAEDVVVEALLMAQGCHGLLSTFSNVSASAVYLSPEGYPYTTFWDTLEGSVVLGEHAANNSEIGALSRCNEGRGAARAR